MKYYLATLLYFCAKSRLGMMAVMVCVFSAGLLQAAGAATQGKDGCSITQREEVYARFEKGELSGAKALVESLRKMSCSKVDAYYQTFLMLMAKNGYSDKDNTPFGPLKRAADFGNVNAAILLGELRPKMLDKNAFKIIVDNMEWSPYAKHVVGLYFARKKMQDIPSTAKAEAYLRAAALEGVVEAFADLSEIKRKLFEAGNAPSGENASIVYMYIFGMLFDPDMAITAPLLPAIQDPKSEVEYITVMKALDKNNVDKGSSVIKMCGCAGISDRKRCFAQFEILRLFSVDSENWKKLRELPEYSAFCLRAFRNFALRSDMRLRVVFQSIYGENQ
jgi:hypothetical protein